jgi:hypothetical protein
LTIAATRCALRFAFPGSTGFRSLALGFPRTGVIIARPSSLFIVRSTYFLVERPPRRSIETRFRVGSWHERSDILMSRLLVLRLAGRAKPPATSPSSVRLLAGRATGPPIGPLAWNELWRAVSSLVGRATIASRASLGCAGGDHSSPRRSPRRRRCSSRSSSLARRAAGSSCAAQTESSCRSSSGRSSSLAKSGCGTDRSDRAQRVGRPPGCCAVG